MLSPRTLVDSFPVQQPPQSLEDPDNKPVLHSTSCLYLPRVPAHCRHQQDAPSAPVGESSALMYRVYVAEKQGLLLRETQPTVPALCPERLALYHSGILKHVRPQNRTTQSPGVLERLCEDISCKTNPEIGGALEGWSLWGALRSLGV